VVYETLRIENASDMTFVYFATSAPFLVAETLDPSAVTKLHAFRGMSNTNSEFIHYIETLHLNYNIKLFNVITCT
jgi:hypothetical protein